MKQKSCKDVKLTKEQLWGAHDAYKEMTKPIHPQDLNAAFRRTTSNRLLDSVGTVRG